MASLSSWLQRRGQPLSPTDERNSEMKRLISATLIASTLALTLGATAASAQGYRCGFGHRGGYGYSSGYGYGGGWRHHDNTGALVGLGIGLFALGAIAAASN